ncbi:MAG: tyrosine-type recombinase/integrase [bacterium]
MAYIYQRGNVYWYRVRLEGKEFRGSTKTQDKKLAQHIANTVEADLVRNKFSLPVKNNYTFLTAWGQYIKSLTNGKETIKNKQFAANHFLPVFKDKNIAAITQSEIKEYQLKRRLEVLSLPKNQSKKDSEINFRWINLEITTLHHFFNFCIEKGLIEKNPASGVKKLNELSRLKTLSGEDIQKLIAGATNKLTRDLITFLIYTGCRKGEALNLKWENVDLKNGVIAIKGTKTKKDRYFPISDALKPILMGIPKNPDSLYVFNRNGAKLTDFKRSFHTACRNAGFKDMHIHDLRHVFGSKMAKAGMPLYTIGTLLGHTSPNMTMKYAHLMPDGLKAALDDAHGKDHFENMQAAQFKKATEIIEKKKK